MWKVKVQEKVKSFAWVLGHNRLLTNLQKSHKGLGDTTCKLYICVCESTMHVFMDYPKAMHIWMNKFPRNIVVEFYQLELVDWMNMHFNIGTTRETRGVGFGSTSATIFGGGAIMNNTIMRTRDCRIQEALWYN